MDHHGLVAAVCQDLKIAERIDNRLPSGPQRKISAGIAVVAMIINGLGFTNRTLYLSHKFFASKPIERLLAVNLKAEDITDHAFKNVEHFRSQINLNDPSRWVADSALYTKERLLKKNDFLWVTRVSETITEAKRLTEMASRDIHWTEVDNGYRISRFDSSYGGIVQRWLLVFSEQAYR